MIEITKTTPAIIKIDGCTPAQEEYLKDELSYTDRKAVFMLQKFKKNRYIAQKMDPEDHKALLEKMKAAVTKTVIGHDKEGNFITYAGMIDKVRELLHETDYKSTIAYPEPELLAWGNIPHDMRYYQAEAVEALLKAKHAAISVCTGGGKSLILLNVAKRLGLKTVIFCPTASIAKQLYKDFYKAFGKRFVGLFGDGKKEFKKLFTIAIDKSLINVKPGTPAYKELSSAQVAIVDESHMVATETQKTIMLGLLKSAPYRFFLSATQFRADGADLLLEGITGPVVYEYTIQQGIKEGYLAEPIFYIIPVEYDKQVYQSDPLKILQETVYGNKKLHTAAATIANKYLAMGKKVMVMIDRVEQFKLLVNSFNQRPGFAYGSLTKKQKKGIPVEYHKMKTEEVVDDFNEGLLNLIVGTTSISMGTDIRPVDVIINLQGGRSEVKFVQLIGRGTRKAPGKDSFIFIDFDVIDVDIVHRWSAFRKGVFDEITDKVYVVDRGLNG